MNISILQLQIPEHEREIIIAKENMCMLLEKLEASREMYFMFGEYTTKLMDAAHSIGMIREKMETEFSK